MKEIDKKPKTLNDDAAIYQQRNENSMKKQISEMSLKEKFAYFSLYYGKSTLVVLTLLIVAIYFLYSVLGPSPKNALYIASINLSIDVDTADQLEKDLKEYLVLEELEEVLIDNTFFIYDSPADLEEADSIEDSLTDSANASASASSHLKVSTYVAAKELDIIIAPKSLFEHYANSGFFDSLDETLPTDVFAGLSDKLYFATSVDNSISKPYGVILDDFPYYQENKYEESRVMGIVVNSRHKDHSYGFFRYFVEEFDY